MYESRFCALCSFSFALCPFLFLFLLYLYVEFFFFTTSVYHFDNQIIFASAKCGDMKNMYVLYSMRLWVHAYMFRSYAFVRKHTCKLTQFNMNTYIPTYIIIYMMYIFINRYICICVLCLNVCWPYESVSVFLSLSLHLSLSICMCASVYAYVLYRVDTSRVEAPAHYRERPKHPVFPMIKNFGFFSSIIIIYT